MNTSNENPDTEVRTLDDYVQPVEDEVHEATAQSDELPEKYRGKSPAELVRMLEEADSFRGKQANEVGELRRLVDNYILNQTTSQQEPEEPIDFYVDPDAALEQRLKNNPTLKKLEETSAALTRQQLQQQLRAKHPDMDEILSDGGFAEWVKANEYRQRQLQQAHFQNDVTAADDLFSSWKERKQLTELTKVGESAARKQTARSASTASARGAKQSTGGKKIYRRTDLIDLRVKDRARYDAMQAEIMQAYAEGRVK